MRISDWSSDVCSSDLGGDDDGFPGVRLGERGAEAFFGDAEPIVRRDIEIGDPGIERGADGRGRRVVVPRPIEIAERRGAETEMAARRLVGAVGRVGETHAQLPSLLFHYTHFLFHLSYPYQG